MWRAVGFDRDIGMKRQRRVRNAAGGELFSKNCGVADRYVLNVRVTLSSAPRR